MFRTLLAAQLAIASAGLAEGWRTASDSGGVRVESREVPGSGFEEIRVTRTLALTPAQACAAIWAKDLASNEPWLPKREVLRDELNDRWFYERVAAPVVNDRDYTVHLSRLRENPAGCLVKFDLDDGRGPKPKPGVVRMAALRGSWEVSSSPEGLARIVYILFNDPGGNVPALLSHRSQRSRAADWVQMTFVRALAASPDGGSAVVTGSGRRGSSPRRAWPSRGRRRRRPGTWAARACG